MFDLILFCQVDLKMSQSQGSLASSDGLDQDFVRSNSFNSKFLCVYASMVRNFFHKVFVNCVKVK